jgi:hypothetical protein
MCSVPARGSSGPATYNQRHAKCNPPPLCWTAHAPFSQAALVAQVCSVRIWPCAQALQVRRLGENVRASMRLHTYVRLCERACGGRACRPMCAREREVGRRSFVAFARSARALVVLTKWLRTAWLRTRTTSTARGRQACGVRTSIWVEKLAAPLAIPECNLEAFKDSDGRGGTLENEGQLCNVMQSDGERFHGQVR